MKIKELAVKFTNELASLYGEDEANAIFLLVIEYCLKLNRSEYFLKKNNDLTANELSKLTQVLDQLKVGKPVQYILGETTFFGLTLKVNEAVLIPRPETEELVGWVLEKLNDAEAKIPDVNKPTPSILDIGTGSGCIAIALKKNLPEAKVSALDVSIEALAIASQNAILNKVNVSFKVQDILQNFALPPNNRYTILISNPPYITLAEKEQMHENVLANEPHLALFVSNHQPLVFYEAIADFALINLEENGWLFFEINENFGDETVKMLADKTFKNIELKKDMQGKDRMICCVKI